MLLYDCYTIDTAWPLFANIEKFIDINLDWLFWENMFEAERYFISDFRY